jgi:predicted ATPase
MKRYIVTGTPGSGKTSILHELKSQGYGVVEEAATDVIAREQMLGNPKSWLQPDFIDTIVRLQKQRQLEASMHPHELQWYDRSSICTLALSQYLGFPASAYLLEEIERIERERIYRRQVFFIENLGFCQLTEARKITFEESLVFEKIHEKTYISLGYDLIKIAVLPLLVVDNSSFSPTRLTVLLGSAYPSFQSSLCSEFQAVRIV